jgi:hypothetical protein
MLERAAFKELARTDDVMHKVDPGIGTRVGHRTFRRII